MYRQVVELIALQRHLTIGEIVAGARIERIRIEVDPSTITDIAVEVVIAMDLETMIGDATGIMIGIKVETVIVITVDAMILVTTMMIIEINVITEMSLATSRATHAILIQHSYRQVFHHYHHLQ